MAAQQTAIHVFSQQASCVLGPSCATFVAFSSQYRWVGGRGATTECSPIYICDDLGDMGWWSGQCGHAIFHLCIHRGFATIQIRQCIKSCFLRTSSRCCRNCLPCSWCLWQSSGSRGWEVAVVQQTDIHVFGQQTSRVLGSRHWLYPFYDDMRLCDGHGCHEILFALILCIWYRHEIAKPAGFASVQTCQCVKSCLEQTTSICSRRCVGRSPGIWQFPPSPNPRVAATQHRAVFSQQTSCVLRFHRLWFYPYYVDMG